METFHLTVALMLCCRQRGWKVPALLRAVATISTLLLLSHWTFWAACHRYGVIDASLESVTGLVAAAKEAVLRWAGQPAAAVS